MPKLVDHDQRRTEIGSAALGVIASEGLDRLTVRKIAAASGWSTGVLAHYARDKDDMIALAVETMAQRFVARLQAIDATEVRERLRALLRELLPLDDERRTEALAWLRLAPYDPQGAGSADAVRQGHRDLRRAVVRVLDELGTASDSSTLAAELVALADGLAIHHLIDPRGVPRTKLEAVLDARLSQI